MMNIRVKSNIKDQEKVMQAQMSCERFDKRIRHVKESSC